jgi:hypothetical protein
MKKTAVFFFLLLAHFCSAQVVCDLTYERTLAGFDVYIHNPSGATMYRAKMYIDADGSPRAYGPNNSGLDYTANAGYPGNWWALITDTNGDPILQGPSDPYPGMYVCATSLYDSHYGLSNPLRYVNSETVPYIAMPTNVLASGNVHAGDVAYVYNTTTGQSCFAIYADAGNTTSIGEGSIYLASQIGVDPDVRYGGTSQGIIDYVVFPQSGFGQGYIPTIAQIDSIGSLYLNRAVVGGPCIVSCIGPMFDDAAPTTALSASAAWDTTLFNVAFTDLDSDCVGGIERSFYQVSDYNTSNDWRANAAHGFFNEDFNGTAIHPDWTLSTGTWAITAGNALQQSDQALSNTNIYAPLAQNLSDAYLYEWSGKISGAGTNRRAGFHFFCDQPDSSNRGNSYFVFFRLDDDKVQIYKVVNNTWGSGPVYDVAYNFTVSQLYDFKVICDRITGLIRVYVNNVKAAQWTDPSPIANGSYVSFRSANCTYEVDNFKVFRTRSSSESISTGTGNATDIRYENPDPATAAGKVSSIVTDLSANISSVAVSLHNIDFSDPAASASVDDGNASDIDTTYNGTQLNANWSASTDANSGITGYYYAIGTTPGASDIASWTSTTGTSATVTGLSLTNMQQYYFSVQAENGALMRSPVTISDGQLYLSPAVGIGHSSQGQSIGVMIYPNPAKGQFTVSSGTVKNGRLMVVNTLGEMILDMPYESTAKIDLTGHPAGLYYVVIKGEGCTEYRKVVLT